MCSYKFCSTFMDVHWEIFQAIKSCDPDKAEELMRQHILNDCIAIDSQVGNYFNNIN
ncbi:FCD domain-containing protein [Neobacillus sp. 19]|uniref:FCD domain-containing protein n=1 Tax=Neobacillus sp. 19 TaxID=3394458 RepID=UPI003BF691BB